MKKNNPRSNGPRRKNTREEGKMLARQSYRPNYGNTRKFNGRPCSDLDKRGKTIIAMR